VRRWLARYRVTGVDGLLRDATSPPGRKPLPKDEVEQIVHLPLHERPPDATHRSARWLAKAVRIGHDAVQKIWAAHDLKPHLVRRFKLSNDRHFVDKLRDIVGLYDDPARARAGSLLSTRSPSGLSLKKRRTGTVEA
jgi:hypothetical protein